MKYHWTDVLKPQEQEKIELKIPSIKSSIDQVNKTIPEKEETYKPEIIEGQEEASLLISMTKSQINNACLSLFRKSINDVVQRELMVGNCVVSNFRESYQDSQQNLNLRLKAKNICRQQVLAQTRSLSMIEKELLIGICISNKINRHPES